MSEDRRKCIAIITSQAISLKNFRGSLIEEFISRGVHCYALAPDFDDNTRGEVIKLGAEPVDIRLRRTSINPFVDIHSFYFLYRLLKELRPDAVLCYSIKPVIYGGLASALAAVPRLYCIIEGAGYVFSEYVDITVKRLLLRYYARSLYRTALKHANKVFFLNPDDTRLFVDDMKLVSASRAVNISGIGINLSEFEQCEPVQNPVTFILVARMLIQKGVREYIHAAQELLSNYQNVRFLLLGDVDENPDSLKHDEIQSWVNQGVVEWPGHVSDIKPWLAQGSVVVLPSYYREGLPRSLMEGMSMGRPVITTDTPGCRETVVDGENGYLIPVKNTKALVQAMERFILQPELIEVMGNKSRSIAEERFDVDKINHIILSNMDLFEQSYITENSLR